MALQSVVNTKLAFGVPGSFYDDSPRRVAPYAVESGKIGTAFTLGAVEGRAVNGGEGAFAGIAVNSKEYPITGLDASLGFKSGAVAQLCTMGHIIVACDNQVAVGNACYYKVADGTLHAAATGSTIEGYVEIPGSKFVFVSGLANEPVVLELA